MSTTATYTFVGMTRDHRVQSVTVTSAAPIEDASLVAAVDEAGCQVQP